ncbi:hypothetical protein GCM10027299_39040 [Larkinella ripae]
MTTKGLPAEKKYYSLEDYFALEKGSDIKHEYLDGVIYDMTGGSPAHSLLANNVGAELRSALRGKPCLVYNSDLALAVSETQYVYPDASIICGPVQGFDVNKKDANNPLVIIEVFSPSTKGYDKRREFSLYRQIPSFRE